MNTKLSITMAIICLFSNAASASTGSVSAGYASDYFYRGGLVATESVQAGANYGADLSGFKASLDIATNQSVDGGADAYVINSGLSKEIGELVNVYLGLHHFELVEGNSNLDVELGFNLGTVLNPSISIFRNASDDLYTFELGANHQLDLDVVELCLHALYGNTDLTESTDADYWLVGAKVSKSISENADLSLSYDYVDSDIIDEESILGAALTVSF